MSTLNALERCPTELLIDGEWRPSSDAHRLDVVDPATGERLAEVASASQDDAVAAVDAASRALPRWAKTPSRRGRSSCAVPSS